MFSLAAAAFFVVTHVGVGAAVWAYKHRSDMRRLADAAATIGPIAVDFFLAIRAAAKRPG